MAGLLPARAALPSEAVRWDATLIVIDSDAELARARALVDQLWDSDDPADIARLDVQARPIAAYEESKRPRRPRVDFTPTAS